METICRPEVGNQLCMCDINKINSIFPTDSQRSRGLPINSARELTSEHRRQFRGIVRLTGRAHNDVIGTSSCLLNHCSKIIKPLFFTSPCHDIIAPRTDEENVHVPSYFGKKTVTHTTHRRPQFRARLPLNRPIDRIGNFSCDSRGQGKVLILHTTSRKQGIPNGNQSQRSGRGLGNERGRRDDPMTLAGRFGGEAKSVLCPQSLGKKKSLAHRIHLLTLCRCRRCFSCVFAQVSK